MGELAAHIKNEELSEKVELLFLRRHAQAWAYSEPRNNLKIKYIIK